MIGYLRGKVIHRDTDHVLIDVSGVGYRVHMSGEEALALADEAELYTHTVVREDVLDLYGFADRESLEFFTMLIKISGVGPKGALGVLSVAPLPSLKSAIAHGETGYLTKVSGIGKKMAEKVVMELRDKLEGEAHTSPEDLKAEGDSLAALVALGYSERDAREALKEVSPEITDTSERIKAALSQLGNGG